MGLIVIITTDPTATDIKHFTSDRNLSFNFTTNSGYMVNVRSLILFYFFLRQSFALVTQAGVQ